MPSADPVNIGPIMRPSERHRPDRTRVYRFLDVGTGFGQYGSMLRVRIDHFQRRIVIDGVEIVEAISGARKRATSEAVFG